MYPTGTEPLCRSPLGALADQGILSQAEALAESLRLRLAPVTVRTLDFRVTRLGDEVYPVLPKKIFCPEEGVAMRSAIMMIGPERLDEWGQSVTGKIANCAQ